MFQGEKLSRDSEFIPDETLSDVTGHTYKVVGFYERFNFAIEDFSCPGYMALTCMDYTLGRGSIISPAFSGIFPSLSFTATKSVKSLLIAPTYSLW